MLGHFAIVWVASMLSPENMAIAAYLIEYVNNMDR
jgi:hypothetical protein